MDSGKVQDHTGECSSGVRQGDDAEPPLFPLPLGPLLYELERSFEEMGVRFTAYYMDDVFLFLMDVTEDTI